MTKQIINFGAGPAKLPQDVLNKIHDHILVWQDTGISILELGHRTPEFSALGEKIDASVRRLLNVPNDFAVLLMPGGAQIQFAMIAMNLLGDYQKLNYVETGYWSTSAIKEGKKYAQVHIAATGKEEHFTTIPPVDSWQIEPNAAYLHFTDNETIGGVEFNEIPDLPEMVLVSDMSSNIFSRPIDFSRMGVIYACAQKNMGIAGMCLVIVRKELLGRAMAHTPVVFNYETESQQASMLATPTTFAWYVASLMLDWIEEQGGVDEMDTRSRRKSQLLYQFIDQSDFYQNNVNPNYRSRMNVPFTLRDPSLEKKLFQQAQANGLLYLQGHRSVGGARASLYNAISVNEVEKLIDFLTFFAEQES